MAKVNGSIPGSASGQHGLTLLKATILSLFVLLTARELPAQATPPEDKPAQEEKQEKHGEQECFRL